MVLKWNCPDAVGLLARVTGLIADLQGNLVEVHQYTDPISRWFFARFVFETFEGKTTEDFLPGMEKMSGEMKAGLRATCPCTRGAISCGRPRSHPWTPNRCFPGLIKQNHNHLLPMKREALCIFLLGISLFAAPFPCLSQEASDPVTPSDGVFIHLTSGPDKVHRTLMALRMAVAMSQEGKPVYLYCDVDAVQLVVKGAPDLKHEAFPSSLQLITDLAANGVTIAVSPTCLKAAGFTPEDLLPEIRIASRSDFFQFTPGRILSLSY